MSLPWGVKESVASEHVEAVSAYVATAENTIITVAGKPVTLLKLGVKEIKGNHFLIFRYQL
ncbi:hypothetical protein [Pelagibaculum spongiae]|uniref:hypothetical protein n=1 Tax=Pelagibaculum spongiae TaxID=2080658 RepID=UPI001057F809|nr:hypothetical protein [Pelagibaculum spongiae]